MDCDGIIFDSSVDLEICYNSIHYVPLVIIQKYKSGTHYVPETCSGYLGN